MIGIDCIGSCKSNCHTITTTTSVFPQKLEDIKVVIRSRKSKDKTILWPKEKGPTTIYKTLHIKLKIQQHETEAELRCLEIILFNHSISLD